MYLFPYTIPPLIYYISLAFFCFFSNRTSFLVLMFLKITCFLCTLYKNKTLRSSKGSHSYTQFISSSFFLFFVSTYFSVPSIFFSLSFFLARALSSFNFSPVLPFFDLHTMTRTNGIISFTLSFVPWKTAVQMFQWGTNANKKTNWWIRTKNSCVSCAYCIFDYFPFFLIIYRISGKSTTRNAILDRMIENEWSVMFSSHVRTRVSKCDRFSIKFCPMSVFDVYTLTIICTIISFSVSPRLVENTNDAHRCERIKEVQYFVYWRYISTKCFLSFFNSIITAIMAVSIRFSNIHLL